LLNGISSDGDRQHELRIRRDLFKGHAHVWGIQAVAVVATFAIHRRPGPEMILDSAMINGTIGIQRRRHGVPLTYRFNTVNDPAAEQAPRQPEAHQALGLEWIPEFTTEPFPELVARVTPEGLRLTEVSFPPSGRAGAVTLYSTQRDLAGAKGDQADYTLNNSVSTPSEALTLEMLVPEGLSDPQTVRATVHGRRDDPAKAIERRTVDLLPQRETAMYLGALTAFPAVAGAPRHHEAVEHVLTTVGWLGERFDVYRCTVAFPLMHTTIGLTVDGLIR
jgi:hypothetical protein